METPRGLTRHVTHVVLATLVAVVSLAAAPYAAAGPLTVTVAPPVFSPNGDGALDKAKVIVRLARAGRLTLGVYARDGHLVRLLQKARQTPAGRRTYAWDGRAKGLTCGDGAYTVKAKLVAGALAGTARSSVTIDTRAPIVRLTADLEPRVFAGGGLTVDIPYTVDEPSGSSLTLTVYHPQPGKDELGQPLGTSAMGAARAAGTLSWDGRARAGEYLPSSRYALVLVAVDGAGNRGSSPALGASVFAPTEVEGRVVTPEGAPVEGAEVDAVGTSVKATSRADGSFTLADCPMGLRVLRAQKAGMEDGGAGARVNMSPAAWTITMGRQTRALTYPGLVSRTAAALGARRAAQAVRPFSGAVGARAGHAPAGRTGAVSGGRSWPWDDVTQWFEDETYRMSGHFDYHAEDGATHVPMRDVRVVLLDYWIDYSGAPVFTEFTTSRTDSEGDFDFAYTVEWDDVGTPDVRVCAESEDADGEVADVSGPWLGGTYGVLGPYYEDNESDRLDVGITAESPDRVAWHLLDAVRAAHAVGYTRSSVDITYPGNTAVMDGNGCFQDNVDTIQVASGLGWDEVVWHEYGHAWMWAAYNDAWADYQWDASDTDYEDFFSEEDRWTALREGWAQFMALRMCGCDSRWGETTFECDYDTPGADDSRIVNSIARALYDLYDDSSVPIWYSWLPVNEYAGPRLYAHYGTGDDDNVQVAGTSTGLETALRHIMDQHPPETVLELRASLLDYFPANGTLRRGIDGAFYRNGVTGSIVENVPHVDAGTVTVTGEKVGGAFKGTVTLWCRVTDPDVLGGAADIDRMKVRFEGCWGLSADLAEAGDWTPLPCTWEEASGPPPGQSGSGWFRADWDTTQVSPVEIVPQEVASGDRYAHFVENLVRDDMVVTAATAGPAARRDFNWVRAVALDGLAESAPVASAVFAIDNGPAQGVSGTVKNAVTLAPIVGATVELRQGTTSVAGALVGTTTTGPDGSYVFRGVAPGGYTAVASKAEYSTNHRVVTVPAQTMTSGQDILLTPAAPPSQSMRSANDGYIRWPLSVQSPSATFELWYRPIQFGGMEYGLDVAEISRDYTDWKGLGPRRWPIMLIWCGDGKVTFQVNENVDDQSGVWHRVSSTTSLRLGQWYHIAAQTGSQGLKLFINGHLEGSDPSYKKGAEANNGAAAGGWFSLGDNRTEGSGYMTASGDFRGLRVSNAQRYASDFTPLNVPQHDLNAVITDTLAGTTNGDNRNFVPTPAGP